MLALLLKDYNEYDYVRSKTGAQEVDFHMNLCAVNVELPTLAVPLQKVYEKLDAINDTGGNLP